MLRETSSSEDVSQRAESSANRKKRSQTFSAHVKSPTLKSETVLIGRKSQFFDSVDITTPYTESVEFPSLQLQSKTMDEMLTMLKQVLNCSVKLYETMLFKFCEGVLDIVLKCASVHITCISVCVNEM